MDTINTLEQRRKQAEQILKAIEEEYEKAIGVYNKCEEELINIKSRNSNHKKLISNLDRLSISTKEAKDKLISDKRKISSLLNTTEKFYLQKYLPLKKQIENPISGVKAIIKKSEKFLTELEKANKDSKTKLGLLTSQISRSREELNKTKNIHNAILKIDKSISERSQVIQGLKVEAELILSSLSSSQKKITAIENDINKKKSSIDINLDSSQQSIKKISLNEKSSESALEKIKGIYQIAAETGLGGEFDKRRNSLKDELEKWQKHLFATTIILLILVVGLFILQLIPDFNFSKITFDTNFYVRFLITSPIIFYLFFATSQYNKAKSLHEKYSFKTAIALSIDAHINLLTEIEVLKTNERFINKVGDFIIDGFDKIHFEPYLKDKEGQRKKSSQTLRKADSQNKKVE